MGDVFEAMNRAKRERGGGDNPPAQTVAEESAADQAGAEQPALPIDQVTPQSQEQETGAGVGTIDPLDPSNAEGALEDAGSVSDAVDRARSEGAMDDSPTHLPMGEAALNGYSSQLVVHHDRGSALTEQYRAIRTQILARGRNRRLRTHVITSSAPGEGKSVTTMNMGVVFSELRNQKTLLVECDLRRPTFQKLLDKEYAPGMLQLLRGEVDDIDDAIHPSVYDNLQFIPAGGRDHINSTELLSSPRMAQIMDRLIDRYDHIFIDSPPVVTVTDAAILGAMCDETLMVVRLYKTPVEVVDRAKRLLRANNCEVTGVVLTHLQLHLPRYLYRYGYGYHYGSTYRYK